MEKTVVKFMMVGVVNTLLGMMIMFGLYNLANCSYWVSSAANYIIGSIVSFILNKRYTFQNQESVWKTAPRFVINIVICYLFAYGLAKPLALWALQGASLQTAENAAMLLGMVLFTGMNYVGQRFFTFRET